MSEWQPGLGTSKAMEDFLDVLIHHAAALFGICEIIPGCVITNVDPAAVGLATIPRYIAVRIHEYVEEVLWRGRPADINVADEVTVLRMAEGDRHEVLGAGGATGFDPGVLAPTARGDILAADATPAWDILALGLAHQILKVNAGATDPVWASFDWDEIAAAVAADMVHDHESAAEGGRVAMIGPDGVIRIEIDGAGDAIIRLGDAAGARTLEVLDSAGATVFTVDSDGYVVIADFLDVVGDIYGFANATFDGFLTYNVDHVTVPVAWTPYTPGDENIIYVNAVGGNITITPDAAAGRDGKYYTIKKVDASANTVTIDPNAAETIDGALTLVITTQYTAVKIHCDGSNWWIV